MKNPFKLLVFVAVSIAALLFTAGIERMVWIFHGDGFAGSLPREVYRTIPEVNCKRPAIEAKRDRDGVLRYRCGTYWPLSTTERSPELTRQWDRAVDEAAKVRHAERTATDPDAVKPRF